MKVHEGIEIVNQELKVLINHLCTVFEPFSSKLESTFQDFPNPYKIVANNLPEVNKDEG